MDKKSCLTLGDITELTFVVEKAHAIDHADDGMPLVLSTPWLIWFMEHSALNATIPATGQGESSVGVHIDVKHIAATPLGHKVTCKAKVIQQEDKSVWFRLEAYDEMEQIAHGLHERRIINVDRFTKRLQKKIKQGR